MKQIKWIGMAAVALLMMAQISYANAASSVKIGVINSSQVLRGSPQLKSANETLRSEFSPREKKLVALRKKLDEEQTKLKRDAAVLSKADREKLQDAIEMDQKNLRIQQQAYFSDLKLRQQQIFRKVFAKVKNIVTDIAKAQKFDLILPADNVVYASDAIDITQSVVSALKNKA